MLFRSKKNHPSLLSEAGSTTVGVIAGGISMGFLGLCTSIGWHFGKDLSEEVKAKRMQRQANKALRDAA